MARLIFSLFVLLAVGAGSMYVGYGLAERDSLKRAEDAITAALRSAELALKASNAVAADEQRRAVASAIERVKRQQQADEIIPPVPVRASLSTWKS